jgi:hypothetical protein
MVNTEIITRSIIAKKRLVCMGKTWCFITRRKEHLMANVWYLVTVNEIWGRGYLSIDEKTPWRSAVVFGPQPIGVRGEHLERIKREFPNAHVQPVTEII